MRFISTLAVALVAAAAWTTAAFGQASDVPAEYQQVLSALGKQGDFKDSVLKVNIPRNDVRVTVAGVATPTPFGFGGWVAMTKGDGGHQVLMGDLVLLQDEVNPVMGFNPDTGQNFSPLHQTGAVYALQPSSSIASKGAGQWNTFEIEATSAAIKVTLNGQPITNYAIPPNTARRSEGHIGLQCHTGNVQFRNVTIRTL